MKVRGCYAASTNNCEGELTKEHIISKALLAPTMTVTINGKERIFTRNNFVVKNLCRFHNNSLRRAEAHMKHYVDFLVNDSEGYQTVRSSLPSELPSPKQFKIKGKYLENWLLKSAINYCYLMKDFLEPDFNYKYISRRLFEEKEFEEPYGLSYLIPQEQLTDKYPGLIYFEPKLDIDDEVCGVCINLQGSLFLIWLPTTNSNWLTREGITFDNKKFEYGSSILWHGGGHGGTVRQQMPAKDGSIVTRSELIIKW